MAWTDLKKTFVDVLEISSPEKISVRLQSVREDYFKLQDSLRIYCSQNSDTLERLQPEPELEPEREVTNQVTSLRRNCIEVVGPRLRSLPETEIRKLEMPGVLVDQMMENNNHCLVRRMSSWHRGLVLSTRDQVRQSFSNFKKVKLTNVSSQLLSKLVPGCCQSPAG